MWSASPDFSKNRCARVPLGVAIKVSNVRERHDEAIERFERPLFDRKCPVAIGLVAALDLHAYLFRDLLRVRLDADDVIALVVRRCLTGKNVPAHQASDDQMLCAMRNYWEAAKSRLF
jgi:hypothetical protein